MVAVVSSSDVDPGSEGVVKIVADDRGSWQCEKAAGEVWKRIGGMSKWRGVVGIEVNGRGFGYARVIGESGLRVVESWRV